MRARSLLLSALVLTACSFDWDGLDPRGGSGGTTSSNGGATSTSTSTGGSGGQGGTGGTGGTGASGGGGAGGMGAGGVAPSYADVVLGDNPSSYWRLGEDPGSTTAVDAAGSEPGTYDGVLLGVPGLVVGSDSAASFDGIDDFVQLGDIYDFEGGQPFSIEAWIQPSATGQQQRINSKRYSNGLGAQGWSLQLNAAGAPALQVVRDDVYREANGDPVVPDSVYHVVATLDGGIAQIFVNGDPAGQTSVPFDLIDGSAPMRLGAQPFGLAQLFSGVMDEVAIYPYALSAAQIVAHHQAGTGAP